MIRIEYIGQFGNCMFQYAFARLHSVVNRINLATHGPVELAASSCQQFVEPLEKKGTIVITDELYYKHRMANGSCPMLLDASYDYVVSGYFQDADLYNAHVENIRSFFAIQYPSPSIDKTLVLIRLGDFVHSGYNSEIIHYDWYKTVLGESSNDRVFSITSNGLGRSPSSKEKEQKYLQHILRNGDVILSSDKDLFGEFIEVMNYKTIVCSNSTWAWWACFLSSCKNIYTFSKFGWFTPKTPKPHGIHINNLSKIRNVSLQFAGDFIDITQL